MLCQNCHQNEATTHYKRIVNGVAEEAYLCSDCAAKAGIGGFADGFSFLFPFVSAVQKPQSKACPTCGLTWSAFSESGMLGCPDCYKTFEQALTRTVFRMSGGKKHVGKSPVKTVASSESPKNETERLREQLKQAIEEENFEQAAVLRDRLKELEEKQ